MCIYNKEIRIVITDYKKIITFIHEYYNVDFYTGVLK